MIIILLLWIYNTCYHHLKVSGAPGWGCSAMSTMWAQLPLFTVSLPSVHLHNQHQILPSSVVHIVNSDAQYTMWTISPGVWVVCFLLYFSPLWWHRDWHVMAGEFSICSTQNLCVCTLVHAHLQRVGSSGGTLGPLPNEEQTGGKGMGKESHRGGAGRREKGTLSRQAVQSRLTMSPCHRHGNTEPCRLFRTNRQLSRQW